MVTTHAKFSVGQLIHHKLYGFRGVVTDVDATFQGSNEWYEKIALTQPPRHEPWYHILVHGAIHHAYAPECDLLADATGEPIEHPEIDHFFDDFKEGVYIVHRIKN